MKRRGKVWLRVFPTSRSPRNLWKCAWARQGGWNRGAVIRGQCVVRSRRVPELWARVNALRSAKLSIKTRLFPAINSVERLIER